MSTPVLRIFSYLPNPRVWKALIAADLLGVEVEVLGDKPAALADWLWDFEARPLEDSEKRSDNPHARTSRRGFSGQLYKTDAFLKAHPFGTVPAAFSPDGATGVLDSNSIGRAVARVGAGSVYGEDAYSASR
ncbi:MAG: glutathione S-transferase, partial [Pseudomonadota bacterium]